MRCVRRSERYGWKEADTGTLGFIPVENMGQPVISDFGQDWMSMGVILDVCLHKREHDDYMFKVFSFSEPGFLNQRGQSEAISRSLARPTTKTHVVRRGARGLFCTGFLSLDHLFGTIRSPPSFLSQ